MYAISFGTQNDDVFELSAVGVDDLIVARGGNDTITEAGDFQRISDDVYFGGAGNDAISSFSGEDVIFAGRGDDVVDIYGIRDVVAHGGKGYDIAYIHADLGPHPDSLMSKLDLHGFEEVHFV